jgi:hypothetical protein
LGQYSKKQEATPTWYMPLNPHPANERLMSSTDIVFEGHVSSPDEKFFFTVFRLLPFLIFEGYQVVFLLRQIDV